MRHFSLWLSNFVSIFRSLIMMLFCIDFFEFILFEGCSPWTYRFVSFAKLRKFSPIISLNTSLIPLFPLLELHDMDTSSFVITPQVPWDCSFSFSQLSLFRLGKSYWAIFKFMDSLLSSPFDFLNPSSDFFFNFSYCIFSSLISIWFFFFFIRFISLLRFSIFFIYFKIIVETFFNWSMVGTQCYIHFRYTTQWLDNSICYIMLTTRAGTICHHTLL